MLSRNADPLCSLCILLRHLYPLQSSGSVRELRPTGELQWAVMGASLRAVVSQFRAISFSPVNLAVIERYCCNASGCCRCCCCCSCSCLWYFGLQPLQYEPSVNFSISGTQVSTMFHATVPSQESYFLTLWRYKTFQLESSTLYIVILLWNYAVSYSCRCS